MRFTIHAPIGNRRGPQYIEPLLDSVHQAATRQSTVHLDIATRAERVEVLAEVSDDIESTFRSGIQDVNAACSVVATELTESNSSIDSEVFSVALRLTPDACRLRTWADFEDRVERTFIDPLAGLLTAARTGRSGRFQSRIRLSIRPATQRQYDKIRRTALQLHRQFIFSRLNHWHRAWCSSTRFTHKALAAGRRLLSTATETPEHSATEKGQRHLFECRLTVSVTAPGHAEGKARSKLAEITGTFGRFTSSSVWFESSRVRRGARSRRHDSFLLCSEEIATLWHPPTETTDDVTRIHRSSVMELEPPARLPSSHSEVDVTELGCVRYRNQNDRFGIRLDDRRRHVFICGKTGMGKSTLILNMIAADIRRGRGVCLVDPHGDLAEEVLRTIPKRRTNDLILFDAGDQGFPLAWNPLSACNHSSRSLVAEGILAAMKKLFGDSWGPRMEDILRHSLLTLVQFPDATLLDLQRLLVDTGFRRQKIELLDDSVLINWWQLTFNNWNERFRNEAIAPVLNKVGQFLANPLIRNIIGQNKSRLDLRSVMDREQILIVNLSQGRVGEPASNLLGAFLVTSLQLAAMSRADIDESERRDFFCYVDEFQNFATDSFATILSQARKYRLSLTCACQYLDQMDEATQASIFGNVGSLVCFQAGIRDAEWLVPQLGPGLDEQHHCQLPRYRAYIRLLMDGHPATPLQMTTIPPHDPVEAVHKVNKLIRTSRERYCTARKTSIR